MLPGSSVQFFVEGVAMASVGLFGIVGNVISIKVLSSTELDMLPTFRHLLKMLAAFDATFLLFTLSLFCISAWSQEYETMVRPWISPYWLPVIQISLTGSVWTTLAVSVERYMTVCRSFRSNTVQHLFYTLPICAFSLLFNIPRFFELRTELVHPDANETAFNNGTTTLSEGDFEEGDNATTDVILVPMLKPTNMRISPIYSRYYVLVANSLALVFFPILLLIILNSLIYRTIAKATRLHNAISSNQRRDHSVAMMLLVIVIVFVICHSMRSIINAYECIQMALYGGTDYHWPQWIQYLVHVNHFALVINSSINILIYSCKDDKFLRVLLITVGARTAASPARGNGGRRGAGRRAGTAAAATTCGTELTTLNGDTNSLHSAISNSQNNLKICKVSVVYSNSSKQADIVTLSTECGGENGEGVKVEKYLKPGGGGGGKSNSSSMMSLNEDDGGCGRNGFAEAEDVKTRLLDAEAVIS